MLHCNRSRTYEMSRTMKQRSLLSLLLLIATTDSSTSFGSVAKCTLTCHNQGICTVGNATFKEPESNLQLPTFHTTNPNGQYCFCQPGWTGTTCDTFFESCGSNGAGCLNGGNCVKGLVDDYGNPQDMCDCSNATDSSGFPYVGKYCEHPFTAYCNATTETFCVNGGECDQKYPASALPCKCPTGYEGIHCEFKSGSVPNCTLDCLNGGECIVGILSPDQANGRYNFFENNDEQFQRCVCPDNYEGLYCEVQKEPCGTEYCYNGGVCKADNSTCDCSRAPNYEGDYCQLEKATVVAGTVNTTQQVPCGRNSFCFNGGTCNMQMVNGEIQHLCDCSTADSGGFSYVGQYCQYLSTDCGVECQKNKTGVSSVQCGDQFCFNGASCSARVVNGQTMHHCSCLKGYAGSYCEYKASSKCSVQCQNGGICVEGGLSDANADDTFNFWNASVSYEHCLCPTGFDGQQCELRKEPCGSNQHCYNGGTCVQTTINGKATFHCDCSSTLTDTSGYAGRYCQYKATEICSKDTNNNALLFCVNGGACIGDGYQGCACPANFTGFSCEFTHVVSLDTSATVGNGITTSFGATGNQTSMTGSTSGSGTTATTAPVATTKSSSANSNSLIDLCTTGVVPPGQPRFFCINGGACKGYVPAGQPHPGCNCLPGWDGPHCELRANSNEAPKKALVAVKVLLILISLGLVGVVGHYMFRRLNMRKRRFTVEERRRLKDEVNLAPHRESFTDFSSKAKSSSDPIASAMASLPGAPEVYIGPPRDEDGHELHNVEII